MPALANFHKQKDELLLDHVDWFHVTLFDRTNLESLDNKTNQLTSLLNWKYELVWESIEAFCWCSNWKHQWHREEIDFSFSFWCIRSFSLFLTSVIERIFLALLSICNGEPRSICSSLQAMKIEKKLILIPVHISMKYWRLFHLKIIWWLSIFFCCWALRERKGINFPLNFSFCMSAFDAHTNS